MIHGERRRHLAVLKPGYSDSTATGIEKTVADRVPVPVRHANLAFEILGTDDEARKVASLREVRWVASGPIDVARVGKDAELRRLVEVWNAALDRGGDKAPLGSVWGSAELPAPGPSTVLNPTAFTQWLRNWTWDQPTLTQQWRAHAALARGGGSALSLLRLPLAVWKEVFGLGHTLAPVDLMRLWWIPSEAIAGYVQAHLQACERVKLFGTAAVPLVLVESPDDADFRLPPETRIRVWARALQGLRWLACLRPANEIRWRVYLEAVTAKVDEPRKGGCQWEPEAQEKLTDGKDPAPEYQGRTGANHALVVWLTPYWEGHYAWRAYNEVYIARTEVGRARARDWIVGEDGLPELVAHEVLHVFGALDEYPWDDETHLGCKASECDQASPPRSVPNGNCRTCAATTHESCVMENLAPRLCAYTRAQVGIDRILVEVTTAGGSAGSLHLEVDSSRLSLGSRERPVGHREVHGFALPSSHPVPDTLALKHDTKAWRPGLVRVWVDGLRRHAKPPQQDRVKGRWLLALEDV